MSPGEAIQRELDIRCWNQYDLSQVMGVPQSVVSALINGKRSINLELDRALCKAFRKEFGYWLKLETEFSLFNFNTEPTDDDAISLRASLWEAAPVREMQRRGWIKETNDVDELQRALNKFFAPELCVVARRSNRAPILSSVQRAWCYRARQMAIALLVKKRFDPNRLEHAEKELRKLAAYPAETRHLPKVLGEYGIRFVVVEPLSNAKIDGAAFWLNENAPVIAVSARFDRIDALWFTIMHEFSHLRHSDGLSVDNELIADAEKTTIIMKEEFESRADKEAASSLVPSDELDSFIRRVGPLYSKERVIQFAHRIRIHPGIIIGQLQHRGELGYHAHRDLLAKIRSIVTDTTLTDGWGKTITPGLLEA